VDERDGADVASVSFKELEDRYFPVTSKAYSLPSITVLYNRSTGFVNL
jgi:hypothetical protein